MSDLTPIGDVLVRFSAQTEPSAVMAVQLREVHEAFAAGLDPEVAYLQMGFLAAKAIERCRQVEGSNAADACARGVHDLRSRGDGRRAAARAQDAAPAGPSAA